MAEAKLNREYAIRVLCVGALMWGVCLWSIYDGKVAWPRINAQMETARPDLLATNMTAEAWMTYEDGATPLMRVFAKQQVQVPKKLIKKVGELRLPDRVTENRDAQRAALTKRLEEVFQGPVYSPHDLAGQTVQAVIAFLLGAMAVGAVLAKKGKRFIADDEGLSGSGFGGKIPYDQVAAIDWKKWDEKGIAVLRLADGRTVKLDSWHYAGMPDVVETLTAHREDLKRG